MRFEKFGVLSIFRDVLVGKNDLNLHLDADMLYPFLRGPVSISFESIWWLPWEEPSIF